MVLQTNKNLLCEAALISEMDAEKIRSCVLEH